MADDLLPLVGLEDEDTDDEGEFHEDDDEEDDDDEESQGITDIDVSYDASLPAQHAYLGTDLEELCGRTVLEDDTAINLPLLTLQGVILIPGQTLPLQLFLPANVSMMHHIIRHDHTFGLLNARYSGPHSVPVLANVGTTAEIRFYKEEVDDRTAMSTLRIKAEGRQRFQVLETRRQSDGVLMGKVRILPELSLGDSLASCRLPSTKKFLIKPLKYQIVTTENIFHEGRHVLRMKPNRKKYDRFSCAHLTTWPPWVYKQYDEELLMDKIRHELRSWNNAIKVETIPSDPVNFSFWVAANMPLDDSLRLSLLSKNSAVQRLICQLDILKKCTAFCCKGCDTQITDKRDMFSMSLEGPQGTYVNPVGYVHETITVNKVRGLSYNGRQSTNHTWFPGYAWLIAQCRNCGTHMGWKYKATNSNLKPERFWGLCRSALNQGLRRDEDAELGF